jgi:DNA-binding response OmpR family regulator
MGEKMDILVVDDNADYLNMLKGALYAQGYDVHTAADGTTACEVLKESEFDLIISDVKMPDGDGLKLHAFARESELHKRTKFIFVTGFGTTEVDVPELNPALDHIMEKTLPVTEIVRKVDTLMFENFAGSWI